MDISEDFHRFMEEAGFRRVDLGLAERLSPNVENLAAHPASDAIFGGAPLESHIIKPKDDEAFRLFCDQFYD